MYKLGHFEERNWVEHIYPANFHLSATEQGGQRLVAGVPRGNPSVFCKLVESLEAPYYLLYVLHTPRGEGAPGRYQSPPVGVGEFRKFIAEFSSFLSSDSRFDIWAHSSAENATVVWDRHNQIFGYGPLARFVTILRALGFSDGPVDLPAHQHYYHAAFDLQAARVLKTFDWSYSPLRKEDVQFSVA